MKFSHPFPTLFGATALSLSLALALVAATPGLAQGQGVQGGGQGNGSGGTTGGIAGPRGAGAGGTTAGSSNGGGSAAGGSATSTGPGSVNQNRYGGSVPVAPPPGTDDPPGTVTPPDDATVTNILDMLQGGTSGGESYSFPDRCAYASPDRLSRADRLSGSNLQHLAAAQYLLAPNFDPGKARTALVLLANYQEELAKRQPDAAVAASYLALTSTRPITADTVGKVNALLCVATTKRTADEIADNAESQRQAEKPAPANQAQQ